MLAEAEAEVTALKARKVGELDEGAAEVVLSQTPPRGSNRPEWYSSDSDSEPEEQVVKSGVLLSPVDELDAAALDLEMAAEAVREDEDIRHADDAEQDQQKEGGSPEEQEE